jgi:type I restriction enzyme S subunit
LPNRGGGLHPPCPKIYLNLNSKANIPWSVDTIGNIAPAESRRALGRLPNPCWLLNLDQIEKDTGYLGEREWVDPATASNSTHGFTTDHVLYSKLRPNLNKVVCPQESGICTTELVRLRPDPKRLDRKFLTYFLRSEYYMGFARQVVAGAKMPRMVMDRFWEFEIPLPPLPEQDRIVEILDQADALRQQRRQADALSQRILPALFHEMFGSSEWPRKPLSQILKTIQGGWSPVCENRPVEGGEWGVLKLGAATYCEYRSTENKALRSECAPRTELEVKAGDLLFTRKNTRELVGATAYVFETPPRLMTPDLIFRLIPNRQEIDPIYLWQAMIQPDARTLIQAQASGAAASMVNISQNRLLPLEFAVPPLPLQQRFAEAVIQFRQSQLSQATSATTLETLFQTLLHRAFDGSLTAKWREGHSKELLQEMNHQAR